MVGRVGNRRQHAGRRECASRDQKTNGASAQPGHARDDCSLYATSEAAMKLITDVFSAAVTCAIGVSAQA